MSEEKDIVRYSTSQSQVISVDIVGEIKAPKYYLDVFHSIRNAGPTDHVDLFINSNGGRLDTTVQLIDAINNCQGVVQGNLVGSAVSAASMIFLACDSFYIAKNSDMMIHTASYGSYGKGTEIVDHVNHSDKKIKKIVKEYYEGFLTPKEIKDLLNKNKDIWLDDDEIHKRLNKLVEHRTKLLEEIQKEEEYDG